MKDIVVSSNNINNLLSMMTVIKHNYTILHEVLKRMSVKKTVVKIT